MNSANRERKRKWLWQRVIYSVIEKLSNSNVAPEIYSSPGLVVGCWHFHYKNPCIFFFCNHSNGKLIKCCWLNVRIYTVCLQSHGAFLTGHWNSTKPDRNVKSSLNERKTLQVLYLCYSVQFECCCPTHI